MRKILSTVGFLILFCLSGSLAWGELVFDDSVTALPSSHEIERYRWQVDHQPWLYHFDVEYEPCTEIGHGDVYIDISARWNRHTEGLEVIVTDLAHTSIATYQPEAVGENRYKINLLGIPDGIYNFDLLFQVEGRNIHLGNEVDIHQHCKKAAQSPLPVTAQLFDSFQSIPQKPFSKHVASLSLEFERADYVKRLIALSDDGRILVVDGDSDDSPRPVQLLPIVFNVAGSYDVFLDFGNYRWQRIHLEVEDESVDLSLEP